MEDYWKSADRCHTEKLESKRLQAYSSVCPPMNRVERRTARGRMLVAQGESAALRAEVEFLQEELERAKGDGK